MAPSSVLKRKETSETSVSPPPLRRKVQSTTTQNAVASFFTPTSQKPPEKISWQHRAPNNQSPSSLLVGKYEHFDSTKTAQVALKRSKIAAFDFDSTLITTSSGKKFGTNGQDWVWWHSTVSSVLRKLYFDDGFQVVVLSNQAGLSLQTGGNAQKAQQARLAAFKAKVTAVFCQLDFPISIYAATEKDIFRKPRTGMWKELLNDYQLQSPGAVDLEGSIFVGDAGGRVAGGGKPKDFSCSDRNFADNIGISFSTPEEYFLGEAPRHFTRTFEPSGYLSDVAGVPEAYLRKNQKDIVIFCGSPGAGKSTFYWKQLQPLGYERVNQDILKSREKCIKVAIDYLDAGKSVVVDNTNPDAEVRSKWVELGRKCSVPIRCVLFTAPPAICEHNDVVRALNDIMNPEKRTILPGLAFMGFASRYQRPELSEGFQDITEVAFKFHGNEAEREIWTRHWT